MICFFIVYLVKFGLSASITFNISNTPALGYKISDGKAGLGSTIDNTPCIAKDYAGPLNIPDKLDSDGVSYEIIEIGKYAFSDVKLTSIVIPKSVTKICQYAFSETTTLQAINLPKVVEIESFAFYKTKADITVTESLKTIGESAFALADFRNNFDLSKSSVETIEKETFKQADCENEFTLPQSLTTIKENAFIFFTVDKINFPPKLTTIGDHAFANSKVTEISFENSALTELPANCFFSCLKLTTVKFGNQLTKLGDECFHNAGLVKVELPSSLKTIGNLCFSLCKKLIAANLQNTQVTEIPDGCFQQSLITTIFLPPKLEKIGVGAFANSALVGIHPPPTLYYIGDSCFIYSKISHISLNNTAMKYLNDRVFYGCSNISDIDLGTKIEKIGNEVFALSSLKTIKIPNIKSIGEGCFFGSQIQQIDLSHLSITSLPDKIFLNCSQLETALLPTSIKSIGESAFESSGLASFDITAQYIGKRAFHSCGNLQSITLTNTVEILEESFSLTSLTDVVLPETLTKVGARSFEMILTLQSFDYGKSKINFIEHNMFMDDFKLENVTFPQGEFKIGYEAFKHTALVNLTLDDRCTYIYERAFMNCGSLLNVNLSISKVPYLSNQTFYDCENIYDIAISDFTIDIEDSAIPPQAVNVYYCGTSCFKGDLNLTQKVIVPKEYACSKFGHCDVTKIDNFPFPVDFHKTKTGRNYGVTIVTVIFVIALFGIIGFVLYKKFLRKKAPQDEGYLISQSEQEKESNLFT